MLPGFTEIVAEWYCHHYPICIRKILPDDTLISMASNAGCESKPVLVFHYAHKLSSWCCPRTVLPLAEFLSKSMSRLFGARTHWGKLSPLSAFEYTESLSSLRAVPENLRASRSARCVPQLLATRVIEIGYYQACDVMLNNINLAHVEMLPLILLMRD